MAKIDYVKIEDRVSVVQMIEGVFVAQVYDGVTGPLDIGWADTYVGPNEQHAKTCETAILAAIRLACEAVQKRCAKVIQETCVMCEGTGNGRNKGGYVADSLCKACGPKTRAIRELEL